MDEFKRRVLHDLAEAQRELTEEILTHPTESADYIRLRLGRILGLRDASAIIQDTYRNMNG